jgi:phytol kinase
MAYNSLMEVILTVGLVFAILVLSELWWRRHVMHDEFSRKFVHITVGSFVAFWPFFLSWRTIQLLSLAFIIVIALSLKLKLFQAIHSVQRPTWGEIFFALAVGVCALVTKDKWVYAAALLQMSLADGMAAVFGVRYGQRQRYLIFNQAKSLIGSLTFFLVSFLILVAYVYFSPHHLSPAWVISISLLATGLENFAVRGSDNLLVPLFVALLLINH